MEGGVLSEADDSTNQTIQEESLTPERANTPEFPPPPTTTINLQNETINSNLNETITLIDSRNDSINNTIKPTFKNIQQAKKRLHAFSVQKLNQLPTSPLAKKVRLDEKIDDTAKKTPKKHKDPNEKAKAVIEEIEEIKRNEQAYLESVRASIDKEHFKKIEKKSRNIRKRSPSIEKFNKNTTITTTTTTTYNNSNDSSNNNKEKKRYPKNWNELHRLELSFDELNRAFDIPPAKGNNDVSRQLLFELPSLPILETKMKTLNREDRLVPFQYVRFTKCKPIISFSINFNTFKEKYPNRRAVFETVPKEMAANIEKLYSSSLKFKTDYNLKVRNWFPKSWIDYNSECKLLENSVGLSFLQSYTEDDNEPTTSININNDIFNKNESSLNINNKNKDKKVVKKMKKKKKKKKNKKKEANDKRKHTETKKKQKKSKIKEKLKKKKRTKAEKHHRCDDKIEQNDEDDNDRNSIRDEKIDEILEMKENTQNEVNVEDVGINKDKNNGDDDEEEEERRIKTTPDTEDYHSHWESDDDLTKLKPTRPSIKLNRSWESDEELFERSGNNDNNNSNNNNNKRKQCDYNNLEIPLNLTNLITRKSINIVNDKKEENSENNCKIEILKPVNLNLDLDIIKTDNNNVSINLENQYEEFIKAVSTDSSSLNQQQQQQHDDNKELIVNNISNNSNNDDDDGDSCSSDTSTSSSSSPTTASSTSTSSDSSSTNNNNNLNNTNSKKKKKKKYKLKKTKRKRNKIQDIFNEFDIPVPSDLPDAGGGGGNSNNNSSSNNVLPLPVPSPDQTLLTITTNNEGVDLKKPFIFPTITIQSKKPLIDHSKLKLNDDSDSCDFTEKFLKKSNEIIPEEDVSVKSTITTISTTTTTIENHDNTKKINKDKNNRNNKREQRNRDRDYKQKNSTKKSVRRHYSSPLLRRYSPKRRHYSPSSPTLSLKQRRKSPSSLHLSRRRSVSPLSHYRRSPRRKRSPSPLSKTRPTSSITTTTKRALSPINSPLDGFKKSVADSTISDDMLPQPSSTVDDYSQSPISNYSSSNNITTKFFDKCDNISSMMIDNDNKGVIVGRVISSGNNNSPKRLSLDDRINQVLGLEKIDNDIKQQQQIDNYHEYNNYQYDQQYYGQYTQNYTNYNLTPVQQQSQTTVNTSTKVVQVGNILQVVPTDEVPHNLIENKTPDTGQKIVQVGNMLQIVPAVIQPTTTIIDNSTTIPTNITTTTVETTPITPILNQDENNQQFDENLMKQKSLERKAERERRRLERSRRRKEKEKKRKEREKRRQLKLKLKTENMIKKALQLEAETLFDDDDDVENSTQWPPIQVVVSASTDTPNKGILLTGGFSKIDGKKSVQFADGIRPGEGTSPSGGEELSSPPPKTKRHKKIKLPKKMKKKKIKVKVQRVQQQQQLQENGIEDVGSGGGDDDNDEEYENLPPPSPPPGSPPPHVFPSRVKEPIFNNINPYIVTNPAYVTTYPRQPIPPPPPAQMVINRPPYMPGSFHPDLHQTHNSFVGTTNHGMPPHH